MARKHDPETFDDEDTAPVPSRIFKLAPLRIDDHIRKRINSARKPCIRADLNDESFAVGNGRRILRLAIDAATGAKLMSPPDWREDWRTIKKAGQEAADAITKLIAAINKDSSPSIHHAEVIAQIRSLDSPDVNDAGKNAVRDAKCLQDAGRIANGLAVDCSRRLAEISKAHPRAVDVEKNTFVMKLAEGWTYLMETPPGLTTVAHENPFLQFVEAGWLDWKGTGRVGEESFVQALNQARKALLPSSVASIVKDHATWRGLP